MKKWMLTCVCALAFTGSVLAETLPLPPPVKEGGMPLMQALNERHVSRQFNPVKKMDMQTLSNLLWAAFGENRPDGRRTAPTARNAQDTLIYVALPEGVFLYNAQENTLEEISKEDIRAKTGKQSEMLASAPVVLIYVSDYNKLDFAEGEKKLFYSALHTGSIYQNVGLFAASEGLNTVMLGMVNYEELPQLLKLSDHQKVLIVQPVGYKP